VVIAIGSMRDHDAPACCLAVIGLKSSAVGVQALFLWVRL
jgi:hypothetical protein